MIKGKNGKRHHQRGPLRFGYLPCEVEDGMFEGERVVSLRIGDQDVSVIVRSESIEGNKLAVEVISKRGTQYLVGLPGESFSTSRQVWVPVDNLVPGK